MDVQKIFVVSLLLNMYFGARAFQHDRKEKNQERQKFEKKEFQKRWQYKLAAVENKAQSTLSQMGRLKSQLDACVKREDKVQQRLSAIQNDKKEVVPAVEARREPLDASHEENLQLRKERWLSSLENLFFETLELSQEDLSSYFELKREYDYDVNEFWSSLAESREGSDLVVPNYMENREFSKIEDRFYEGLLELLGPVGFEKFLDHQQTFNSLEANSQRLKGPVL